MSDCKHDHSHDHNHPRNADMHDHTNSGGHSHHIANYNLAFQVGISLNFSFVIIEFLYGVWSHSLSLVADAGHNLGDVLSLLLAWGAFYLTKRRPNSLFTYGFKNTSILASAINAITLFIITGMMLWAAINRFQNPESPVAITMMAVAGIGILVNGITAIFFYSGGKSDLNLRGAFVHLAADALISLAVVVSGVIIYYTQISWIDPLLTVLICLFIIYSSWGILKESFILSVQGVPSYIKYENVKKYLEETKLVTGVHDLHIWAISTNENALSTHLKVNGKHPGDQFLQNIAGDLKSKFRIHHTTIQIELGDTNEECALETHHKIQN